MSRRFFGTDGVRGLANRTLTPEFAFSLGQAAGNWIGPGSRVVVGRDTRISGTMLGAALASGFCSAGVDANILGIVPTPTISYVARTGAYRLGAVVSASHNPAEDNGIKFVGSDGRKLTESEEESIESLIDVPFARPELGAVGSITQLRDPIDSYIEYLVSLVPEGLTGCHVALDAANGAAYELAPRILERLGANVSVTGTSPDGININAEGGATKPDTISRFTVASGAHLGVAFDGDADRAIFADEKGRIVNGDRTIGIWAGYRRARMTLEPAIAVGTVMSNGAFEEHLGSTGVTLVRAPVGDKYVAEAIDLTGALVGGEQSGHIIFPELGPTGDGLITMLELLRVISEEGRSLSSFYDAYEPWPQLLVNMGVDSAADWRSHLCADLDVAERRLEGSGRLVVRPSGTQPMLRVMVEARDVTLRDSVADELVEAVVTKLGGVVRGRVDLTYALGD